SAMPTRVLIIALAGILSFASVWLIAAESIRPGLGYFPKDTADAPSFASEATSAGLATSMGWPRGDLASESAVAVFADGLGRSNGSATSAAKALKETSLTAVHLAPYDARPWVTLATQEQDPRRRQQL